MEKAVEIQNLAKLFDSNQKLFPSRFAFNYIHAYSFHL